MTFDVTISLDGVHDEVDGDLTLTFTVATAQELHDKLEAVLTATVADVA